MSGLTTHILDLVAGRPAAGVRIAVLRQESAGWTLVAEATTNADGRVDKPLVPAADFQVGTYQLEFHVGDYFGKSATGAASPVGRFLDVIPLRFGVADPGIHYHVPLLVTPWAYSTYRGS